MRTSRRAITTRRLFALGAALAGLALAGGAARADVSRVGVVVASRIQLSERDADAVAGRLGAALRAQLEVEVVAGAEARRLLPARGIPEACVATPDCLRAVADRLRGDELLLLYMVRTGPRLQVDVTWCDPDIGVVINRTSLHLPALVGPAADRVLAAAPRQLLPHAAPRGDALEVAAGSMAPARGGRRLTAPVIVTGAVAVGALAGGVGFAVAARAEYNALEDDGCARASCPQARRRVDQMDRRALVADILFGTAAAAAATSAVLYLFSSRHGAESRVEVGAAPSPGGGALVSLGGVF
ncbi:MAG TPA: hypothetical protein VKB80_36405 [Kofleriaceae bacterium]|nr:hypothetical protein [Kofleriaceae bacterium]